MATIESNIQSMAKLVADVKKTYHLTENTVLRIVDMNFALAQSAGAPSFSGQEQMPFDPTLMGPQDEDSTNHIPTNLFPDTPSEIEAVEESDDDPETVPAPLEN